MQVRAWAGRAIALEQKRGASQKETERQQREWLERGFLPINAPAAQHSLNRQSVAQEYDLDAMSEWDERRAKLQAFDAFVQEHQLCGELSQTKHDDGRVEVWCPCGARIVHHFDPGDIAPPPVM